MKIKFTGGDSIKSFHYPVAPVHRLALGVGGRSRSHSSMAVAPPTRIRSLFTFMLSNTTKLGVASQKLDKLNTERQQRKSISIQLVVMGTL